MLVSCPSLRCSCRRKTRLMQRSKGFGHGVIVVSKNCCNILIAPLWLLQRKLLAFVGWKWGCQRFSWRRLQNVRHCRKEICSTCFFKESIPAKFPVFIFARTFKSWRDQRVGKRVLLSRESQSSSNSRVDVWVLNQWWIRMIFRRKFCIPKICSPRSIQATHAHACHSGVSIIYRFFGFWSPRTTSAASCKSWPHISM